MLYIFIYKPKKKEIKEVLTYTQSLTKNKKTNTAPSKKNPYTTNTYPTYYKNIKST